MTAESKPNLSLLVIDRSRQMAEELKPLLMPAGHHLHPVHDHPSVLEILDKPNDFDAILLVANGSEAGNTAILKSIVSTANLQGLPVIVIAGNNQTTILDYIKAGAEDYLIPPFDATSLEVRLRTSILKKQLQQDNLQHVQKIENDLRVGREIQQTFLPSQFPSVNGWEIGSFFSPARSVSGDFYDVFLMHGNRIGFFIGDVCDKGIGAALFMSLMRSLLRAYAMQHYTLNWASLVETEQVSARKLRNLKARNLMPSAGMIALENAIKLTNNYVATTHSDLCMFATTFFGVLDTIKGTVTYINGGHTSPVIIDGSGSIKQRLEVTGPAVGMLPDSEFDIAEIKLDVGDTLFAYTDGVTDAQNATKTPFGENNLLSLLQLPHPSLNTLIEKTSQQLLNFIGDSAQFDDIAMLAIRRSSEQ